jgi:hypothetical protein
MKPHGTTLQSSFSLALVVVVVAFVVVAFVRAPRGF